MWGKGIEEVGKDERIHKRVCGIWKILLGE